MAKKVNALLPDVREQECDHPSGFTFTGKIPCTGPRVCHLCNSDENDVLSPAQTQALADFLEIAKTNDFDSIITVREQPRCGVWLKDGTDLACLAVAYIEGVGAWTVLTREGVTRQYTGDEIR